MDNTTTTTASPRWVKIICLLQKQFIDQTKTNKQAITMMFNPHKLGIHKILSKIPLNAIFDTPYKAQLKRAVNIADLRLIAKARAHKVTSRLLARRPDSL
jgi:hypothetical protein